MGNNKNRILSIVLALALFLSCNVFLCTDVRAALPDRAGFADSTEITLNDFTTKVPTYWESDIYDSDEYRAYCTDDVFVMLIIDKFGDVDGLSFENDVQRSLFVQAMLDAMGEGGVLKETSYKTFGEQSGAYAIYDVNIEDKPFKGTIFATISGDECFCYMLVESPDNKYDYQPDFFKSLDSTKKNDASEDKSEATDNAESFSKEIEGAIKDAKKYLALYGFSKKGLINQLSSEYGSGYSVEDSTKAVEYLEKALPIDWNEQAVKSAETYNSVMKFDRAKMIEMLTSEFGGQYTKEQAEYAVDKLGLK